MTITLHPDDLTLVVDALNARADQRARASTQLSEKLAEQRAGGKDVRSAAVRVVDELASAGRLRTLATALLEGDLRMAQAVVATRALTPETVDDVALSPGDPAADATADDDGPVTVIDIGGVEVDLLTADEDDEPDDVEDVLGALEAQEATA